MISEAVHVFLALLGLAMHPTLQTPVAWKYCKGASLLIESLI